jgi:peptide/nickel transport system substrate-binding protein
METRFGIKDFFLFLLVGVLIVLVVLASFQFDRQYERVELTYKETQTLAEELNRVKRTIADVDANVLDLQDRIEQGVAVVPGAGAGTGQTTRPSAEAEAVTSSYGPGKGRNGQTDPFYQVEEASAQEDFARGGWYLENFGTKIGRLTPLVSSDIYQTWVQNLVLEPLAQQDPYTLEWMPRLARRWEISEDGLVMTFHLRRNATFSDGVPVTADDVIFTFDWIRNPDVQADRTRSYLTALEKVEKLDDYTVRFTFKEPYYQNFAYAAGPDVAVMPKHFYEKYTPTQFNEHVGLLMGSGPYMVEGGPEAWTPGNGVSLVRNPRYWGAEPTIEKIVYGEIESEDTQAVRFRNHEQDIFRATPDHYVRMINDPSVMEWATDQKHNSPYKGYSYIGWNQQRETGGNRRSTFFADKRVRQAMTLLIDRERMSQEIAEGLWTPASGPFDPAGPQSDPSVQPLPHDLQQAQSLLREAGFDDRNGDGIIEASDGRPFEFTLTYPGGSPIYEKIVLFLRDSFARGGIKMNAERVDWPVLIRRMNVKDFDAVILGWSSTIESDPYQIFHSSQIEGTGDNRISYRNAELDKAIEEARRTMDLDKRLELWQQVHRILAEDQPYTFLFNRPNLYIMNGRIKNVEKSKVGLNYEPLFSTVMPWYIPQAQQHMSR